MMKKKCLLVICFLFFLSVITFSQVRTGLLSGRVMDLEGEILPGVNIIISSPALIGGSSYGLTNRDGFYRFLNLPPGDYTVKAEIQGFKKYKQDGIKIRLGLTTTVNISLEIGSLEEEVTVVAETPIVDIETNRISTNYEKEFIAKLPSSRNTDAFTSLTPGVVVDTVSGVQYPDQSALGGAARENYYSLDGTYITDPAKSDQMVYWNYDIIEEAQVEITGHDAQYGNAPGAVINVLTKSGGNELSGLINLYYRNKSFRSDNFEGTGLDAPSDAIKNEWEGSLNFGGPILRDKIWYFLSGGYNPRVSETAGFPADIEGKQTFLFGKTTMQFGKNNISLIYNHNRNDYNHLYASPYRTVESTFTQDSYNNTFNLQWNYIISQEALLEVRGAYVDKYSLFGSNGVGASYYEIMTGVITKSSGFVSEQTRSQLQLQASFSYWLQNFGGNHDLKAGFDFTRGTNDWDATALPNEDGIQNIVTYNGEIVSYLRYDPANNINKNYYRAYGLYVQDSWNTNSRFVLNFGARLTQVKGIVPKQNNVPEPIEEYSFTTIEPRIGLTYDLSSKNRQTVIKAHYGRYYLGSISLGLLNPNYWTYDMFSIVNGQSVLVGRVVPGSAVVDPDLKRPSVDTITVGFETSISRHLSFKANAVYKKTKNFVGIIDSNRTSEWYEPEVVINPITNSPITIYGLKPNVPPIQAYYTNPEVAERNYYGMQLSLERSFANNFQFMLSYAWGRATGTVQQSSNALAAMNIYGTWNDPNALINAQGLLDLDKTHLIKFGGVYLAPYGITIGLVYFGQSGYPYARSFSVLLRQGNVNINGEEPGEQRTPFQHLVNVRLEKSFSLGRFHPRICLEVFNLLNSNILTGVGTRYGTPTYMTTMSIMPPRTLRASIGVNF